MWQGKSVGGAYWNCAWITGNPEVVKHGEPGGPEVRFEEIPRKPMSEEFDGGEVL